MVAQVDKVFKQLSLKKTYTRYLSYIFYEGRPLTTKGRWINPFVFSLFWLQTILPFAKPVIQPVFIIGTGRSGTTILGVTLGIHKDVGFLNEPKALWSFLYDNEDLIGSYQRLPGKYNLTKNDVTLPMIKRAHRILGNYLRFGIASRVVDKYPELIFRTEFILTIFPDAHFLFLYRNAYDTCSSIQHWSERLGVEKQGEIHDWWGVDDRKWKLLCDQVVANDEALAPYKSEIFQFSNHVDRAVVEWVVTMKKGISLMSRKPEQVMGVKYEDYVGDPETRQKVLEFCGLESDAIYNQYCETVLKAPKAKPEFDVQSIIKDEFALVMKELGYAD